MEENKLLQLLQKHGVKFFLALLILCFAGFWMERLRSSKNSGFKQDFLIINQIIDRFRKGEFLAEQSIESAETILKRHPELHPKMDSVLATSFLLQQNSSKALLYAKPLLDHVKSTLDPFYVSYGHTSFVIAEQKYELAISEAEDLQKKLGTEKGYDTLSGLNLLRLIFLADLLDKKEIKAQKWAEFKIHPAYNTLSALFKEGELSLADYF